MGGILVTAYWDADQDENIKDKLAEIAAEYGANINVQPNYRPGKTSFSAEISGLSTALRIIDDNTIRRTLKNIRGDWSNFLEASRVQSYSISHINV